MNPIEFLKTIYLGDRACKGVYIDCWNSCVRVQVDCISRVRSASGNWEFYTQEDIIDGYIVFTEVESIRLDPAGPLPNDYIYDLCAEEKAPSSDNVSLKTTYEFQLVVSSVDRCGLGTQVTICILATGVHLENPKIPDRKIIE